MIKKTRKEQDDYGHQINPFIRKFNVEIPMTEHQVQEYLRCKNSVEYFAENYCKVIHPDVGLTQFAPREYQNRMLASYVKNRFTVVLTARQSGKTITNAVFAVWYAIFYKGKAVAILANKATIAKEILNRATRVLENLPYWLQPGSDAVNKTSLTFDNESSIIAAATSSSSIRGLTINLLMLDEFAFIQRDEEFYTSTYPVIVEGKKTKVIIVSTANGVGNMFYNIWQGACNGSNDFYPIKVTWREVPGRDEEWKKQQIRNTSELQFRQEHECEFLGSSSTLIDGETLMGLQTHNPVKIMYDGRLLIYEELEEDERYAIMVDTAKGRGIDYSTITVIKTTDLTKCKQVAIFRDNWISPILFPEIVFRICGLYDNPILFIENNDAGQVVANALNYEFEYDNLFKESSVKATGLGVTMTKRVKRIGCSTLKDLIEGGALQIIDTRTIRELCNFSVSGVSYEAASGHDDLVMNLVLFAWAYHHKFVGEEEANLKDLLFQEKMKEIEDEFPATIFVRDSSGDDVFNIEDQEFFR